jgi:spore coat polysaccharide biosynthesis protein SpsF (cytidylyltransferase family)
MEQMPIPAAASHGRQYHSLTNLIPYSQATNNRLRLHGPESVTNYIARNPNSFKVTGVNVGDDVSAGVLATEHR